jgi:hypothetical protein
MPAAKAHGKTTAVISPLALEAVRRIDALFDIERSINGQVDKDLFEIKVHFVSCIIVVISCFCCSESPFS